MYERLKIILLNKELRIRLAQEGRRYVEQYHDHIRVAQRFINCLESKIERYDHYPTFFARQYRLPPNETIPEDLKRLTAEIIRRWGLPPDVDPQDMILRGLTSADGRSSKPIPRWDESFFSSQAAGSSEDVSGLIKSLFFPT